MVHAYGYGVYTYDIDVRPDILADKVRKYGTPELQEMFVTGISAKNRKEKEIAQ